MISGLASLKKLSPNHSGKRKHEIDRITYHCFVGQVSAGRGAEVFMPKAKKASCNYVVGYDGSIAAVVDEENRSWCTSSSENDNRAITVEIASGTVHPYEIRDAAYDAVKSLTIDIMRRLGKSRLVYIKDKAEALSYEPKPCEILITEHKWFAAKSCPGAYIESILQDLTDAVNRVISEEDIIYDPIYRVQVGAFKNKQNANRMLKLIQDAGFADAYINDQDLYRVQTGAFRNKLYAMQRREEVKKAGFDAYIKETTA